GATRVRTVGYPGTGENPPPPLASWGRQGSGAAPHAWSYPARMELAAAFLGLTLVMSAVAAVVNSVDKWRAVRNREPGRPRRRVSERTLHALDLLGGWPGGLLARRVFHHKQNAGRKRGFIWTTRAIVALHLSLWAAVGVLWFTR